VTGPARGVWFVVPEGVGDPERVTGGNVYDQRVSAELRSLGWDVRMVETTVEATGDEWHTAIPDGGLVLVDGLAAIRAPSSIEAAAGRVRVVVLAHMAAAAFDGADPRAVDGERRALPQADRIIATSEWLRDELLGRGLAAAERVVVATPGADEAALAMGSSTGGSLLCVGVVAPHKGQDTLVAALAQLGKGPTWTCTFAGSTSTDPSFATVIATEAAAAGLARRVTWAGVLNPRELEDAYAHADLLIAPSRTESYGIAVGDALRRGIPVIASRAGGIPEAAYPQDAVILVPPGDRAALRDALHQWLHEPGLRARMSTAARHAAPSRRGWTDTARTIHSTLVGLT
jgi:glycosyltransferase involved in cell wall biosynthesis